MAEITIKIRDNGVTELTMTNGDTSRSAEATQMIGILETIVESKDMVTVSQYEAVKDVTYLYSQGLRKTK